MQEKELSKEQQIKNYAIERTLLSGIIKYPESFYDIENFLLEGDFANVINSKIYSVFRYLILQKDITKLDTGLILATISNMCLTFPSECIIADFVANLKRDAENIESPKTVKTIAQDIYLLARRRDFYKCGDKIQRKAIDGAIDGKPFLNIQDMMEAVDGIYFDAINKFVRDEDMVDVGDGIGAELHKRADNPVDHEGFKSGYPHWDKMIGYFQTDSFNFVSARPKVGKSIFAMNVATHVSLKQNIPVFYADSEMNLKIFRHRLISHIGQVDYNLVKNGYWRSNPEVCPKVLKAIDIVDNKINIKYFSIRACNINSMISACRRFLFQKVKRNIENPDIWNPCLFIWDYIKLDYYNKSNMGNSWWLDIAKSTVHFKDFLGKTQTTALVLGQQNQGGIAKLDKNNKMVSQDNESIVAGSDEISKSASNVSSLRRKTSDEIIRDGVESGNYILMPLAAREGEGGGSIPLANGVFDRDYVSLQKDGIYMTFKEITTNKLLRQKQDISSSFIKDKHVK